MTFMGFEHPCEHSSSISTPHRFGVSGDTRHGFDHRANLSLQLAIFDLLPLVGCPPLQRSSRSRPVLIQRARIASRAPNVYFHLSWGSDFPPTFSAAHDDRAPARDPILAGARARFPTPAECISAVSTTLML
jgi:hypothetical protein